jgi:hypothetical protein
MEFISNYTWLPRGDEPEERDLTRRYIAHYPVGLMAFILKNRRLYSEEKSQFPNIYTCNITESESEHISTIYKPEGRPAALDVTQFKDVLKDYGHLPIGEATRLAEVLAANLRRKPNYWSVHGHSYWVRRLILQFIAERNARRVSVKLGDVLDAFSSGGTDVAYPSNFVRIMLGTLAENHSANLVTVSRELTSDQGRLLTTELEVTPRGLHLLEDVVDKFYYLQLIVDDPALPLPKKCRGKFEYDELHYGYLAAEGHNYGQKTRQMIRKKAFLVVKMLALLELALEIEEIRYSEVFRRLRGEAVRIPSPEIMFRDLIGQFDAINSSVKGIAMLDVRTAVFYEERKRIIADTRAEMEKSYGFA